MAFVPDPFPHPPASVVDHSGEAIGADADFFQEPPREIGRVLSARTIKRRSSPSNFYIGRARRSMGCPAAAPTFTPP